MRQNTRNRTPGYAAYLLGVGSQWIAIGVIIIVGFGIIGGAHKTRPVEKSD